MIKDDDLTENININMSNKSAEKGSLKHIHL